MTTYAHDILDAIANYQPLDQHVDLDVADWRVLVDARRGLTQIIEDLENSIGQAMNEKRLTAAGVTVERHRKANRTKWDTDSLRRLVLDSRIVDPDTGEIRDETPVDKLCAVWNLGAPRVTALRARGIDPDEFSEVERIDRWTLREYA